MTMSNNTATTVAFVFSCMEENGKDMVLVCPQCCKHIVIDPTNLDQYRDGMAYCYWCKFAAPVEGDVYLVDCVECSGCGQLYTVEELSKHVCDAYDDDDDDGFKAELDSNYNEKDNWAFEDNYESIKPSVGSVTFGKYFDVVSKLVSSSESDFVLSQFDGMTQPQVKRFAEKCEEIMDLQAQVKDLTWELNKYKELAKKYRQMMDDIECPF